MMQNCCGECVHDERKARDRRVNWGAVGAVGEIVGAAAVVVTLAYLAVQVGVARRVAADSNRLTRASGVREFDLTVVTNERLLDTLVTAYGLGDYCATYGAKFGIEPREAARIDFIHQYFFWLHWGQYASTNDAQSVAELEHLVRAYYAIPAVKHSWTQSPLARPLLDPCFVAFVDEVLTRPPETSDEV